MDHVSVRDAILTRQATRRFRPDPVPRETLVEALRLANQAPSSYNLQWWYFVVVDDPGLKKRLRAVSMGQAHTEEAAVVVVFCADPLAARRHAADVMEAEVQAGRKTTAEAARRRRHVALAFEPGPLGLFGLAKRLAMPLVRLKRPFPALPASTAALRQWAARETMLAVQTFLLAARSLGLATCPIGAFDEGRLKRLLGIPHRVAVPVIVAVGYPAGEAPPPGPRLPLDEKLFWNGWGRRVPWEV